MKKKEYTEPLMEVITMSVNSSLLLPISGEGGSVGDGAQWAPPFLAPEVPTPAEVNEATSILFGE
ncbi:MAG: hypothetical protein IJ527_04680 [Prevotella sp.]|nr:hypothetical protein [Prevotella sp.]